MAGFTGLLSGGCYAACMAAPAEQKPRLQELDALRGIAALVVLLFHYSVRFHELFPAARHVPYGLMVGHYAILLFFAISGFVIFFSLERIDRLSDFAIKRFARLYPAYWVAMAVTLVVEYVGDAPALLVPPATVAANLTMLHGFLFLPGVDGVYWTLGTELAFYICMGALWFSRRADRIETILAVWMGLHLFDARFQLLPSRISMLLVLDAIPYFAIGIITYRVWAGQRSWREQLPLVAWLMLGETLTETMDITLVAGLLLLLFAAVIAGRARMLAHPALLWLGTISYSLYLMHHNIGFVVILRLQDAGWNPWAAAGTAMLVAFGLAMLLHHFVEEPAARAIGRWWKRRRNPSTGQTAAV
ncbi:acyltransferase [soil metagenome]